MATDNQVIYRLILAVFLGGIIGLERQIHHRAAGLRTHILVSLGSALIMLTSLYIFGIYQNVANVDPGRIAAGVITGIGFLGAGTIFRQQDQVMGLTTAASLWAVAAIGLAVGCGFLSAALVATALVLTCLFILRRLEKYLGKG
ncbi:MAG: MgtC/SapB family protein [Candidatus Omnitrophota bacterium]